MTTPQITSFRKSLLSVLFTLAFMIAIPVSKANEINPVKSIKPEKSAPSLNIIPERTQLTMQEKGIEQSTSRNVKSKPSWWKWLTNASNKPASFHYIDIIELLN